MSSETACFNGYAEEFLEVQMADPMSLKLFADLHNKVWWCEAILLFCAPELDIRLAHEPLMKVSDIFKSTFTGISISYSTNNLGSKAVKRGCMA